MLHKPTFFVWPNIEEEVINTKEKINKYKYLKSFLFPTSFKNEFVAITCWYLVEKYVSLEMKYAH